MSKGTARLGTLLLATLLSASVSTALQAKEWKSIRIGTEGAYPPFNFMSPSGEVQGFDIEVGKALCQQMQAKCTTVTQDWDGIIPALKAGKYDLILASMFITEERKKQVAFTDPYYKAAMSFAVPADSNLHDFTPKALEGKVIGAQAGTTQGDYLTQHYPKSDVRLYPTQEAVNLDMASGRLDLQLGDAIPLLMWTKSTDDGKCCQLAGEMITDPKFVGEGVGIAVRLEDQDLREQLNQALAAIIANGTYQKINNQYFPINIYTLKQ